MIKSTSDIKRISKACQITAKILSTIKNSTKQGVSTQFLNEIAERELIKFGAIPAFKNYKVGNLPPFPTALCVSINEEVVHGIPKKDRILKNGDIVSLDFGVNYKGFYGDSAITIPIGEVSKENNELINASKRILYSAIKKALPGNRVWDISKEIQKNTESLGYSIIIGYGGHGIGKILHERPFIPCEYEIDCPDLNIEIKEYMTLAIEVMISKGKGNVKILNDSWTVSTKDDSIASHFEHTIVVQQDFPKILTE